MNSDELQRWFASQQRLLEQFMAEPTPIDPDAIDWEALRIACSQLSEQNGNTQQAELAQAMTEQVQAFCRYGVQLLQRLRQDPDKLHLDTLVFDFCRHLETQALNILLRQWRLPGSLLHQLPFDARLLPPFELIEQFLNQLQLLPQQPRFASLRQALVRFQQLLNDYRSRLEMVNRQAAFRLLECCRSDTAPQSLADLHSFWVECYENSYAEMLHDTAYQQLYGELTNSSLRLQQIAQSYFEPEYRQLGLVPQQDYNDLLRNHHQLRKQLRHSQQHQQQLTERLARLEQIVEQLQQQAATPKTQANKSVSALRKRKA